MTQQINPIPGAKRSLLPLLFFVALFLGTGLYLHQQDVAYAFYQLPGHVAIIPALILAILLHKAPLQQSIDVMIKGAGNSNIITMCIIYLLAGAFASVASATGGVDAAVNAGLSLVPSAWLLPGLFIIAALVSTAMGTSMGTIGALAPIAVQWSWTLLAALAYVAVGPAIIAFRCWGEGVRQAGGSPDAAVSVRALALEADITRQ